MKNTKYDFEGGCHPYKMSKVNLSLINFRSFSEEDLPFLYQVYRSTRWEEMQLSGWTHEEIEDFLKIQFQLQHTQYLANYKNASFDIILLESKPIGRLYIDRQKEEIRIMDIALLDFYRKKGIGSKILKDLIAESENKKMPITLHVEYNNPAKAFYLNLGFIQEKDLGVYHFMKRTPSS
ncbi:GNAT family N-acetyltransferase [Marinisporobacter balticus]|uniref:GNAT family N-acetyltransferase n=1 Tax=Marinisporobacter balticus TaxID=2018667 RepID=UPI0014052861|nr:GNAT family N-acetyltransferase [Marinisporobacter balticus]